MDRKTLWAWLRQKEKWQWWHGVLFYAIVEGLSFGIGGLVRSVRSKTPQAISNEAQQEFYRDQKLPTFSPSGWVFPIAWTINNISVIWGLLRVLNKPTDTEGRNAYLSLQAATWLEYVLFNAAYFALRSPVNAFVLTVLYLGLTIVNVIVALFGLRDSKVALSLATLVVWLLIATPASFFQMLWNRDPLYNVGPFAEPQAGWLKSR